MESQEISHTQVEKLDHNYRMFEVSEKSAVLQIAVAQGCIFMQQTTLDMIKNKIIPNGDFPSLAEVSGILAAKKASDFIPFCRPLTLDSISITFELVESENLIKVFCKTTSFSKTGVETEALAGVNGALLAIYDSAKQIDRNMTIGEIKLLNNKDFRSNNTLVARNVDTCEPFLSEQKTTLPWAGLKVCILAIRDHSSWGDQEDESGDKAALIATTFGAQISRTCSVSDDYDEIELALENFISFQKPNLIFTTGGTGLSPRDKTPEVLMKLADKEVPGIGELLRKNSAQYTPYSYFSRSLAVVSRDCLIVALPGSTKAIEQGMSILKNNITHAIHVINKGIH